MNTDNQDPTYYNDTYRDLNLNPGFWVGKATGVQLNMPLRGSFGPEVTPSSNRDVDLSKTVLGKTAIKHDDGKTDWSLLPFEALEEVVKVMEFGKTKYSAHNWSSGEGFKYSRVFNASMRHLLAFMRGEDKDPETGLSHIAHCACNILFLLHFIKFKDKYNNCDDRQNKT